jgi:hypothetical protein
VTSGGKSASKRDQGPVIADATTAVPQVRFKSRIAAANESVVPEGAALGERFGEPTCPIRSGTVRRRSGDGPRTQAASAVSKRPLVSGSSKAAAVSRP